MHNEVYGSEDGRGELSLKHESGISNALAAFGAKRIKDSHQEPSDELVGLCPIGTGSDQVPGDDAGGDDI